MSSIVAFVLPVPGHLYPCIPILQELDRRGHSVALAVCSETDVVSEFARFPMTRVAWPPPSEPLPSVRGRVTWYQDPVRFAHYGEPLAQGLERVLRAVKPDAVLIDPKLWGAMVAAEAAQVPWASIAHNPLLFCGRGMDGRGPGWAPPSSAFGRFRHRALVMLMHHDTTAQRAELNATRARRGLAPLQRLTDVYQRAPLILATTVEPFEYPRSDWPTALRFVGPMIWTPPSQHTPLSRLEGAPPLVVVAGSTVAANDAAASWAVHVINTLADGPFQIVATLPTEDLPLKQWPNVRVYRGLSHDQIFPGAACVICHGGSGVTLRALWYAVPVVAIPSAYDRFEVARRVERAGAGAVLTANHLRPNAINAAVRKALASKKGAERVSKMFRSAGGAAKAADHIEALLGH